MQCLPLSKFMIKKIDAICRSFMWTGGVAISRKSLIIWKKIFMSRKQDGLNIIELETWNKMVIMKLLWNLNGKSDSYG